MNSSEAEIRQIIESRANAVRKGNTGKQKTGAEVDLWFRTTLGLQRRSGQWLIVHEHSSSPFDAKSGQASLGLKPQ